MSATSLRRYVRAFPDQSALAELKSGGRRRVTPPLSIDLTVEVSSR